MSTKENKSNIKREFEISLEQYQSKMNNNNNNIKLKDDQREDSKDKLFKRENANLLILKRDNEDKELNDDYKNKYSNEIFIIENQNKKTYNKNTNQKPIYTKIKTESSRNQKNKISNYIYKSGKVFQRKNNTTNNLNNCIMNTAKYSIKNPIKEKSKKKFKKNNINETDINNNHSHYNNNYNNLNEFSNSEELENINYINQENYLKRNDNELDDVNDKSELNIIVKRSKNTENNIINLQKPPKKNTTRNISLNNLHETKFKYIPNTSKGEGRITYICDYSQENNKDSYYIESPNEYNRHMSLYPINPTLKKKKTKKNKYIKGSDLKKEIEDSKKKFEKIREIEREIKNYFNLNGLDIINRELYDQSATMIQATFRAYLLRIKLYAKLNLYIDLKSGIDILKKIFLPRKINFWEIFINSIFEYINTININNNIDNEEENEINLNSEKYQYLNDEFNEEENSRIKYVKKITASYKYKKPKNKIINDNLLMAQSCISLNFEKLKDNNYNEQEDLLNKILKENEELKRQNEELRKNNIIKDTQESVELKLNDNDNLNTISSKNNDKKIIQLKYILKLLDLKLKRNLYKYFLKLYNKSLILKYTSEIKSESKDRRNKIIKRLIQNKEKNLRNLKYKIFFTFYYKGFFNINKNDDQNNVKINENDQSEEKIKDETNNAENNND